MSKEIQNVNFDKDSNRLYINENDVNSGDYIVLDNTSIIQTYLNSSNTYYKTVITDFKEHDAEYNSIKKTKEELQLEVKNLHKNLETAREEAINKFKASNEYLQLTQKIAQLTEQIKNTHNQAISEFKSSKEYLDLQNQNLNLNKMNIELSTKINTASELAVSRFKESEEYKNLNKLVNEKEEKIKQLEQEKKDIENRRNLLNTKLMGEDFEVWCKNEYEKAYQYLDDVIFEKTTKEKNGTKPDFIFEVFSNNVNENNNRNNEKWRKDNLLGRVIFEMKTEATNSDPKNRKSNESHLEKLEKERKNFEADIAVLVSELEKEDDFIIKRSNNYSDVYIIRPQAFVSIVGFFRASILKRKEIRNLTLNFEEKQKILDKFNDLKNSLLENAIKNIRQKCEDIKDKATKIIKSGEDIINDIKIVQDRHLSRVTNKIENFNINKEIKNIENLTQNSLGLDDESDS